MYSVEVTAKKAEDALKDALKQLSATIDDVDVKVLEAGGLFRSAKLVVTLTPDVNAASAETEKKRGGRIRERKRLRNLSRKTKPVSKEMPSLKTVLLRDVNPM